MAAALLAASAAVLAAAVGAVDVSAALITARGLRQLIRTSDSKFLPNRK